MKPLTQHKNPYAKFDGLEQTEAFLSDAGVRFPGREIPAAPLTAASDALALLGGEVPENTVLRCDEPLTLTGLSGRVFSSLTLIGSLVLENCRDLSFNGLTLTGSLTDRSTGTLYTDCRVGGTAVFGGTGISFRHGEAKEVCAENAVNFLLAQSAVESVSLHGGRNNVCLLNKASRISVRDVRDIFVCENAISTSLSLSGCDYAVVNGNRFAGDATLTTENLTHFVGCDVTDCNARAPYGVNRDIMPQGDKDLFLCMERRSTVREAGASRDLLHYIMEEAAHNPLVIVAPGAYAANDTLTLEGIDRCVIYAYGVLLEKDSYRGNTILIRNSKGVMFKGLAIDHTENSTGQGVVIAKEKGNTLRLMHGAGMLPDWSDNRYYSGGGFYGYRPGHPEPYADMGCGGFRYDSKNSEVFFTVGDDLFRRIEVGDTLVCRGAGWTAVQISTSWDTYFEDFTVYGAAGFAFNESSCHSVTILNRVWDTTGPAAVISKTTYDTYRLLEKNYGVSFGVREDVSPDGQKIYRGTAPVCSSVDATHTNRSVEGTVCLSCIFESMCDDGTNQNASHARLRGFRDNGDGTLTVLYKLNISEYAYHHANKHGGNCAPFYKGDRVYIYTSAGKLICDSPALADYRQTGEFTNQYNLPCETFEVDVARDSFDTESCGAYDMVSDVPTAPKILIDNMTRASNGFVFDNVLVQNIRSRGLLIKASNGTIANCSFYNCGMSCIAILYEIFWGESGVSEFLDVKNNYFEHTGYYRNIDRYAPIAIEGLGSQPSDEFLLYNNIRFTGNVMRRRATDLAVYINSAKQVQLIDNDFGTKENEDAADPKAAVFINCAKDIELSGNRYPHGQEHPEKDLMVSGNRHVFGRDVGDRVKDDPMIGSEISSFALCPPTEDVNGNLYFDKTPWSVGCSPVDELNFRNFKMVTPQGWYADAPETLWGGTGGVWKSTNLAFAAQGHYNVGFRYRSDVNGKARIGLTQLAPDNNHAGLFAIFLNGKMIFPHTDGSYTEKSDWLQVTRNVDARAVRASLSEKIYDLRKGDEILFLAKSDGAWSAFTALPAISILK